MAKAATINISTEAVEELKYYLSELECKIKNAETTRAEIEVGYERLGAYEALRILGVYVSVGSININFAGRYCGYILEGIDD